MDVINVSKLVDARKAIELASKSGEKVVVLAKDDDFNRKIFEHKKVDVLVDVEGGHKRDRMKQRDSGLNQVLCKLAKGNGIFIGVDLRHLNNGSDFDKSQYLSRLIQNVRLCKKYKVPMVLVNIDKGKKDLNGLLLTLGMNTSMAKFAFENSFSFN
jgi:RNase P/RNase MRP subunit p30